MTARVLDFPCSPAARLQVDGLELIAFTYFWADGIRVKAIGLYRPVAKKWRGWYQMGDVDPNGRAWMDRTERARALRIWKSGRWELLTTGARAFPEKRRRYVRPPKAPRMPAHAV